MKRLNKLFDVLFPEFARRKEEIRLWDEGFHRLNKYFPAILIKSEKNRSGVIQLNYSYKDAALHPSLFYSRLESYHFYGRGPFSLHHISLEIEQTIREDLWRHCGYIESEKKN